MKSRLICMMLVVVLLLSVAATAMAGPWRLTLLNPSSSVTIDDDCRHLRTAGTDRNNLWKIRITGYTQACQGDGVFFNCYESDGHARAGVGFDVTDTQLHRGGWQNGYYPQHIEYSPGGRLRPNEPDEVTIWGGFGSQES